MLYGCIPSSLGEEKRAAGVAWCTEGHDIYTGKLQCGSFLLRFMQPVKRDEHPTASLVITYKVRL